MLRTIVDTIYGEAVLMQREPLTDSGGIVLTTKKRIQQPNGKVVEQEVKYSKWTVLAVGPDVEARVKPGMLIIPAAGAEVTQVVDLSLEDGHEKLILHDYHKILSIIHHEEMSAEEVIKMRAARVAREIPDIVPATPKDVVDITRKILEKDFHKP